MRPTQLHRQSLGIYVREQNINMNHGTDGVGQIEDKKMPGLRTPAILE
jgi:hypothetical protein